jgi:hypothetical protein
MKNTLCYAGGGVYHEKYTLLCSGWTVLDFALQGTGQCHTKSSLVGGGGGGVA